jgi:NAD+ synthase
MLMALSNKFGEMLLTTGNKSEMAVGYCTIYGDMNGGYNPVKDMYKTRMFLTARWRNENHRPWMKGPAGEVIPAADHRETALGRAARQPARRRQPAAL